MRARLGLGLGTALLLTAPTAARAQQAATAWVRWTPEPDALGGPLAAGPPSLARLPVGCKVGDYRYEGLAVGGGLFGLAGAVLGWGLADAGGDPVGGNDDPYNASTGERLESAAVGFLLFGSGGGLLGFLYGLTVPKVGACPVTPATETASPTAASPAS